VTITVTDVSPETIVGTSANETFVAGAGNDSFATNITTGGADSVNFGAGLDRVTIDATLPTNVLLRFTSAEVGNGNANDSNTLANQDGGLAVRVSDASNVEGPVTRTDDEGMVFIGGTGVTFNVTDLPSGVSRGNAFEVAILGTSGADTLTAVQAARPYYFNAGGGNDSVTGGTANDFLVGGGGDDVLAGLGGNNSYIGGAGIDTVSYAAAPGAIYVDLIGSQSLNGYGGTEVFVSGIENVIGSTSNDIIIGDNGNNVLTGGGGSDYLIGRDGNDTLISTLGVASALQGGVGNDVYVLNNVGDSPLEFAAEGNDTVQTTLGSFTLGANIENLVYTGAGSFTGGGNGLDNSLTGGTANDTLTGGAGADTFNAIASNGLDVITDFTSGSDRIVLDASYTQTATVDFVSGAGAQTATGTNSAFLYDTSTGILSYDADGTGAGAAVQLFNLGAGTTLVSSDVIFPIMG
jgi:Ca2+-binding RTX toxin-like protein